MENVVDRRTISYKEWLEYRRAGIGGSDIGAIVGVNPYTSILSVFFNKIGESNWHPQMDYNSDAIYWGKRLEPLIAQEFCKQTGYEVEESHYLLKSSEHPFMLANPDRLIVDEEEGLEIKTSNAFNKDAWEDESTPAMYFAQVQHYMAVTGYHGWWLAVLIGGNKFSYRYIERNDEYIDKLIQLESHFWNNYVVPKVMPNIDGSLATTNFIKHRFSNAQPQTSISLNGSTNEIVERYLEYSELESKYSELKDESANQLKMLLGEHEKGATDNYLIKWNNVSSTRFDSKTFQKDNPDLFKQYAKESSYRRFSVKSL